MISICRVQLLAFVIPLVCGCGRDMLPPKIDPVEYIGLKTEFALVFDLSDDHLPNGGTLIDASKIKKPGRSTFVVPFSIGKVSSNKQLLNTHNSFTDYSIINFLHQGSVSGIQAISFKPRLLSLQPGQTLSNAPGTVYFVREGLERKFIYKFSNPAVELTKKLIANGHKDIIAPKEVVIKLPSNATGKEIKDGKTAIPSHLYQLSQARVYPAMQTSNSADHLEIWYEVPPNARQDVFAKGSIKLLGVLAAPILLIAFLPTTEIKRPRLRSIAISIGVVIQIAILLYLAYLIYVSPGTITVESLVNIFIVILGIIASGIAYWIKREVPDRHGSLST